MFICDKCLEEIRDNLKEQKKDFKGHISFLKSFKYCEQCKQIFNCNEWIK